MQEMECPCIFPHLLRPNSPKVLVFSAWKALADNPGQNGIIPATYWYNLPREGASHNNKEAMVSNDNLAGIPVASGTPAVQDNATIPAGALPGSQLSIVLPARNEAVNLRKLLPQLLDLLPGAEVIVVNDASRDDTVGLCNELGVKVVSHQYQKGNGASIKTGARIATRDLIVFMDGDGQHKPADILRLLQKHSEGYDMVVGARSSATQASKGRLVANTLYNRLSSWISNQDILDLTSGFRIVKRQKFLQFLYLLPNGFSYPTTITMAFFRAGYSVAYVDIDAGQREGKSHINLVKDGIRFFLIIFKIGTLYSPLKIFLPISFGFFCTGVFYYLYTFLRFHTFTNMSAVLFMTAIIVFLIGLVSEQVTTLIYKDSE